MEFITDLYSKSILLLGKLLLTVLWTKTKLIWGFFIWIIFSRLKKQVIPSFPLRSRWQITSVTQKGIWKYKMSTILPKIKQRYFIISYQSMHFMCQKTGYSIFSPLRSRRHDTIDCHYGWKNLKTYNDHNPKINELLVWESFGSKSVRHNKLCLISPPKRILPS